MRKKPNRKFVQRKFYSLNEHITANSLRVVDHESKQVGLLTRDEALAKAREMEADLVLIAPKANPPVAKIIDFKKFLYQEDKKQKEAKKGAKKSTSKDIKLSLFIAEGDSNRLLEKGKQFLAEGNQLRLNLGLRGRELGKRDMAFAHLRKFIADLGDVNIAKEPKMEGRVIRAVISKKK